MAVLMSKNIANHLKYVIPSQARTKCWPVLHFPRCFASRIITESFKFNDLQIEVASKAQQMPKPDQNKLAFGEIFSDHMFEVEWTKGDGWGTPRIVPLHNFVCHPGSKIFHYAQAVFEGMKAFKHSDGSVALFRPDMNMRRMVNSTERAALPVFDGEELLKCLKKLVLIDKDWVPEIKDSSLYIRPTIIGTQNSLGVMASSRALLFIVTCPVGPYFASGFSGVTLLADPRFVRAWPGGAGGYKMASNYAPSLYVQRLAQEQGLNQVLWLFGDDHQIAEGGAMNAFFFLSKGNGKKELVTPPLDGTILPGVVRQSLLELAKGWKEFEVSERVITMKEIIQANKERRLIEMFLCGTACILCPVTLVRYQNEDIKIPTMEGDNPLYQRLLKAITDIQYGRVSSEWSVRLKD